LPKTAKKLSEIKISFLEVYKLMFVIIIVISRLLQHGSHKLFMIQKSSTDYIRIFTP